MLSPSLEHTLHECSGLLLLSSGWVLLIEQRGRTEFVLAGGGLEASSRLEQIDSLELNDQQLRRVRGAVDVLQVQVRRIYYAMLC